MISAGSGEDGTAAGQIELTGDIVSLAAGSTITANNAAGSGGSVAITGVESADVAANVEASGSVGGGAVSVTADTVELNGARLTANPDIAPVTDFA